MKKTITINGDVYTYGRFEPVYNYKRTIWDLYDRPSDEKVDAYNEWYGKLEEIHGLTGSKFNFSIYGCVKDED